MESKRERRVGMAEQTTWGTAVADNAAVIELDCEPFNIQAEAMIRRSAGSHGSRFPIQSDIRADTRAIMTEVTIPLSVAKKAELALLLAGVIQNVTSEAASTPFNKVMPMSVGQPVFETGNAGYTLTLFDRQPTASESVKLKDVIVQKLQLQVNEHDELKVGGTLVGRGIGASSTPSGTWTISPNTQSDCWYAGNLSRCTINFGGGAQSVNLKTMDLTIENELRAVGGGSSGDFTTYGILSKKATMKFKWYKDANAVTAKTNFQAGTAVTITIGWQSANTVDGYLNIVLVGKIIAPPAISDDELMDCEITVESAGADASTTPLTIDIADAVDRNW